MEVLVFGFPTRRFMWGTSTGIKTARRRVASAKQFIKVKVHSQGGRAHRFLEIQLAPRLFWNWILLGLFGLGGAVTCRGWSLMVAVSSHLEDSSHRLGKGVFDPPKFLP